MKISPFLPLALIVAAPAFAQQPIRYDISFDNAVHHEARVEVTFPDLRADTLEVVMSRAVREFREEWLGSHVMVAR